MRQLLSLVYGLLALAVIIALLGIVNTLALSIVERTREIGLLRAVGATRRQVRRMITWESLVIAVYGAVLGAALGLLVGQAFARRDGRRRHHRHRGALVDPARGGAPRLPHGASPPCCRHVAPPASTCSPRSPTAADVSRRGHVASAGARKCSVMRALGRDDP